MLSNQITSIVEAVKSGGQSAPVLLSEIHTCEVCNTLFGTDITTLDDLAERTITDLLYYNTLDGSDGAQNYKIKPLKEFTQKLHQKPSGDILIVIFRNFELFSTKSALVSSANSLLNIFEDVPTNLLIIVTSPAPQKIIPTLLSRMILIDGWSAVRWHNPHQWAIDDFLRGKPEALFRMTLAPSKESKFTRDDALWIVQGLQDAVECGKLATKHAKNILTTRIQLETTNTIAKYLIDQLLISLVCE